MNDFGDDETKRKELYKNLIQGFYDGILAELTQIIKKKEEVDIKFNYQTNNGFWDRWKKGITY